MEMEKGGDVIIISHRIDVFSTCDSIAVAKGKQPSIVPSTNPRQCCYVGVKQMDIHNRWPLSRAMTLIINAIDSNRTREQSKNQGMGINPSIHSSIHAPLFPYGCPSTTIKSSNQTRPQSIHSPKPYLMTPSKDPPPPALQRHRARFIPISHHY